ncbi:rod-binding protein [Roseinatronobacter sp.]|uniref:rod-binding protein n=1 Tax=Roseinatronobacter sp. TaxID=1945755 RepID=UPI003F6F7ECF
MEVANPASPGFVHAARAAAPTTDEARAAHEFETVFLSQAVEEMMRGISAGEFGGGHGEEMWRSFMARALAEEIAAHGSIGIARSVEAGIAAYSTGKASK